MDSELVGPNNARAVIRMNFSMSPPRSRFAATRGVALLVAALAVFATPGCGGKSAQQPDPAVVKQYADRGYAPAHHYETTASQETWTVGSETVDVVLTVPAHAGTYPLVVYLPGLGEPAEAGAAWRKAWAQAGYAVLSAQSTRFGPAIWSSSAAHAGDFYSIAKDAFSARSLAARAQLLQGILDEASRRQRGASGPTVAHFDMSHMAVAGFDLGAQTAMVVAGAHIGGVDLPQLTYGIKCVIALSPYADFSGMGTQSNFADIRLPVLSVTSPADTDAYGLVTSAAVRRAPFQYMPAGRKTLLLLSVAPHSLLAGGVVSGQVQAIGGTNSTGVAIDEAAADPDIVGDESDGRPRKKRRKPSASDTQGARSSERAREVTQVQAVTTAYLDAVVADDTLALEWLTRNAQHWLGDSAELVSK
jgi:hypothetical protein